MALLFLHISPEGSPSGFQAGQMPARAHFLGLHLTFIISDFLQEDPLFPTSHVAGLAILALDVPKVMA